MEIKLKFDDGIEREYVVSDEIAEKINNGWIVHISFQHPEKGELFRVGAVPRNTIKIDSLGG